MNSATYLVVCLLGLACFASISADDDNNARLLASKNILNEKLVEGKDLTAEYKIFNVGRSTALNVELADASFPETDFEVVSGKLNAKWTRIAPNSNVSHVVILKPLKAGYFNFTSAEISYLPNEDATVPQKGYSSGPGEGPIELFKEYDRKYSPHFLDWAAFGVMSLPSLGMPFLLWYSSHRKYE